MATAKKTDLSVHQGSRFYTQFQLKQRDSQGNITILPLSNKAGRGQIRAQYDNDTAYDLEVEIVDVANGYVTVHLPATTSASLPIGPLVYDVEIYDLTNNEDVIKPLWGNFYIRPEVTR